MKFRLFLITLLLSSSFVHAQSMLGIWRGYFYSGYGAFKQQYKYEVQLNELPNPNSQKALQGVTYSYRSTVFYGKASLQGIYDSKNKSITIKELKLVELKIADKSEPCLMTCYLDYRKEGTTEILEGTFTSINANSKGDCGSGYVHLERKTESDFQKEDFLVKKTKPSTKTNTQKEAPVVKSKPATTPPAKKNTTKQPSAKTTKPQPKTTTKPKTTTPVDNTAKNQSQQKSSDTVVKVAPVIPPPAKPVETTPKKIIPAPDVIKNRDNALVKTIVTNSTDITIQLYDNGEIDGDTITVFDNNQVIAYRKGLSKSPITLKIKATADDPIHEIVMVANNLGSIPPNTALMTVSTGDKHYELFISSDEKKNAKILIQYKPAGSDFK